MYYTAKFFEAAGLGVLAVGFLSQFPKLMDMRMFFWGLVIFAFGWVIENFFIPHR